jgi:hypothetical protein
MEYKSKLPPLAEENFDGEKQKTELKMERCSHSKVSFKNGELWCPCGAAWSGPNLHLLYKLLHK